MTQTPPEPDRLFVAALEHALAGDTADALRTLERLAAEHGDQVVTRFPGALAHIAHIAIRALGGVRPKRLGNLWTIGSFVLAVDSSDTAQLFAAGYVTALADGDPVTATALLCAEIEHPDGNRLPAAIVATLALTVALIRLPARNETHRTHRGAA